MNPLIEMIKSMEKRKLRIFLIILQFTIGFSALISFIVFYNSIFNFSSIFQKITDVNKTSFMIEQNVVQELPKVKKEPDFASFYNYIKENKNIMAFGTFAYYNRSLELNKLNNNNRIGLMTKLKLFEKYGLFQFSNDMKTASVVSLMVDEGFNNMIKIPLSEGSNFNSKDFSKNRNEIKNILLGSIYKKYFKLGDIITLEAQKTEQFRVSGFIKNDSYFYNSGHSITMNLINLNNILVIPISAVEDSDQGLLASRIQQGLLLQLDNKANTARINEEINTKAKEMNIPAQIEDLNSIFNKFIAPFINANLSKVVLGLCFCVFSAIGLVTTLIVIIYNKKREIGIRLACGASIFNIFSSFALEIICICIIAFIASIGEYTLETNGVIQLIKKTYSYINVIDPNVGIDIFTLAQLFIVVIFILGIIAYIMLMQLKKLQPKDLIGGIE